MRFFYHSCATLLSEIFLLLWKVTTGYSGCERSWELLSCDKDLLSYDMKMLFSYRTNCHLLCNNIMIGASMESKYLMSHDERHISAFPTLDAALKSKHFFIKIPPSAQGIFIKNCWAACFCHHQLMNCSQSFGIHLEKVFTLLVFLFLDSNFLCRIKLFTIVFVSDATSYLEAEAAAKIMPSATMWIMILLWNKNDEIIFSQQSNFSPLSSREKKKSRAKPCE